MRSKKCNSGKITCFLLVGTGDFPAVAAYLPASDFSIRFDVIPYKFTLSISKFVV
jgi:hypothetical protein